MTATDSLAIGPFSATLPVGGAGLRDLAANGDVLLRGLAFVVRDRHWGTYVLNEPPRLDRSAGGVEMRFEGRLDGCDGDLTWQAVFRLSPNGIEASCVATSRAGFNTCRTGLVVLHALGATRGQAVRVGHPDGSYTEGRFPALVAPHQPFRDVATLDYRSAGGARLQFDFEDEIFETEDQRNWTDASYKTYGRSLLRPYPYLIGPGESIRQRIRLAVTDIAQASAAPPTQVYHGRAAAMPKILLGPAPVEAPGSFLVFNRGPMLERGEAARWSSSPTMHAADDDTIGETIESLPDLIATARAKAPQARIQVGPIRLEGRFKAGPAPDDARRGTVLEAAWVAGTVAGLLDGALDRLHFPVPVGATETLLARLVSFEGCLATVVHWQGRPRVCGLVVRGDKPVLVVVHLAAASVTVPLPPGGWTEMAWLDEKRFGEVIEAGPSLTFRGFGVAWCTGGT